MANMHIQAQEQSASRGSDGTYPEVRGDRSGIPFSGDAGYAFALNGEVYVANGGSASSPITFAGAYDADGPDFVIDVPDGTTIQPLYIHVQYEAVGTTLLLETFASISNSLAGTCTVTGGAAVTPRNLRTGVSTASGCTVNSAVDAAGCTAQTGRIYELRLGGFELAEAMAATEPGWPERNWKWSAKEYGIYPTIDGEGSLFVHAASQAGTGFITVAYREFTT